MILEKFVFSFAFNLRKQNVTDFSFISLTQTLRFAFKLLLAGTVRFSISYQLWLIRQWLLINASCLCLVPSLIFSPTKSVWKCCFHFKFLLEIKKQEVALSISRHKGISNKHLGKNFFYENRIPIFLWRFEYRRRRLNSNYSIG